MVADSAYSPALRRLSYPFSRATISNLKGLVMIPFLKSASAVVFSDWPTGMVITLFSAAGPAGCSA